MSTGDFDYPITFIPGVDNFVKKRKPMNTDCACAEIRRQGRKTRRALAEFAAALSASLDQILAGQSTAVANQEKLMSTLADVTADVAAETTVEGSVLTLLQGLAAQVAALQPNQASIDALHASLQGNITAMQAAVAANTPAAAPPAGNAP